ncbi:MAG: hypothetical protein ACP5HC_02485 [Caldisericum sp.]
MEEYRLPQGFGEEYYIPEDCKKCKEVEDEKKVGIKIWTPYSYLLLEGCSNEKKCPSKIEQLLFYGLGVGTDIFNKARNLTKNILYSDITKEEKEEAIEKLKVIFGYFPDMLASKEYKGNLPKSIELIALGMIYGKIPGVLCYPLPVVKRVYPTINPVTKDLEIVKEILDIPGDRACVFSFAFKSETIGYIRRYLVFLTEEGFLELNELFCSGYPKEISVDLLDKWFTSINVVISEQNEDQIKSFIETSKFLGKYIKIVKKGVQ